MNERINSAGVLIIQEQQTTRTATTGDGEETDTKSTLTEKSHAALLDQTTASFLHHLTQQPSQEELMVQLPNDDAVKTASAFTDIKVGIFQ
jgi:hypothetical protein